MKYGTTGGGATYSPAMGGRDVLWELRESSLGSVAYSLTARYAGALPRAERRRGARARAQALYEVGPRFRSRVIAGASLRSGSRHSLDWIRFKCVSAFCGF